MQNYILCKLAVIWRAN